MAGATALGVLALSCLLAARGSDTLRRAVWATWIGLVPVSLMPSFAGLASSLALGTPDPVQWMTPLVGPVIGLAMLVLIFANALHQPDTQTSTCCNQRDMSAISAGHTACSMGYSL